MTGDGPADHAGTAPAGDGSVRTWRIYQGTGGLIDEAERDGRWPPPPPWRDFTGGPDGPPPPADEAELARRLGRQVSARRPDPKEVDAVNAALYLRRPLLVTGRPGVGKSSLAYQIARELRLGRVLHWPISSRVTLRSGLYDYDAIGRAQAAGERAGDGGAPGGGTDVGDFVRLGPLGTALLPYRLPRVLLIDEMDKGDIDLPNDLLNVFEEGAFAIPELTRIRKRHPAVDIHTADPDVPATVHNGVVRCHAFPIVVITSNGEREFPAPFLRRCLSVDIPDPDEDRLAELVAAHFAGGVDEDVRQLIADFVERREGAGTIAADQLLNAVHLVVSGAARSAGSGDWERLLDTVWRGLSAADR